MMRRELAHFCDRPGVVTGRSSLEAFDVARRVHRHRVLGDRKLEQVSQGLQPVIGGLGGVGLAVAHVPDRFDGDDLSEGQGSRLAQIAVVGRHRFLAQVVEHKRTHVPGRRVEAPVFDAAPVIVLNQPAQ
jgi:hypothetical protein